MRLFKSYAILINSLLAGLILISTQNLSFGQVFVNEIHYDNTGGDVDERIEVAG